MGDNCCLPFSMGSIKSFIEEKVKGAYVVSLMIGSNPGDDSYNSYFMPVHKQLEMACALVSGDAQLAAGFHAIGFSQGGLFVRALAQTCPGAKVINLISIGGPQQGIFGLPDCLGEKGICEEVKMLLDLGAYTPLVQNRLVQAQYWHDPRSPASYQRYNVFLPGINNEGAAKNATYKERLLQVEKIVLVKFLNDTIVVPRDSEWFGFYAEGQDAKVLALEESRLYIEDWLGLKTLKEQGRLLLLSCLGQHLQMPPGFFAQSIIPLLTPLPP
jgi:palmitoyl-protein thioesterase